MLRVAVLALLVAGLGCTGDKDDDGSDDTSSGGLDGGLGGGGDDSGGGDDGQSPTISDFDAWCYEHTTGETRYIWAASLTADDPQGADTLESIFDGLTVSSGGSELAVYSIVCDDEGACSASFNQDLDNIACANADAYTLEAKVLDDEGNWSSPSTVTGKQCSSTSGC